LDTRHRKKTQTAPKKIDTGNIGHKTQKEDTGNIGHKTQKEDTDPTKKDRHGEHWVQGTERRHTPPKKIDTGNIEQVTERKDGPHKKR
jgi:hypothetical protein